MHRLEMPRQLARRGAQRHDGIRVAVVAQARDAVVVNGRAGGGQEHEIALRVRGDDGPGIGAAATNAHRPAPGAEARIGRILRHGIPGPAQRPAARVEGTHFAGGAHVRIVVGDGGAHHDEIADDGRRRGLLVFVAVGLFVAQPGDQVDLALAAKAGTGFAAERIQRDQARIDGGQDDAAVAGLRMRDARIAPVGNAAVHPVAEAAIALHGRVARPELFAGDRIECDDLAQRRGQVHAAFDHQRRGFERGGGTGLDTRLARLVLPGQGQFADVVAIDLAQWRMPVAARRAAVVRPVAFGGNRRHRDDAGQECAGSFHCFCTPASSIDRRARRFV